ncbi:MAG: bifunctional riboflavin kinase/FAD synthetase, partial [candidate division WOR-3 bacterium]|nr:bifunctional riboflavin kinase/FAD synthetase [candidate division WOR-3 bacterium]
DGVHRGHNKIITTTKNLARLNNCPWGIITFSPIPQMFLYKDFRFLLTTDEEKWAILAKYQPDFVGVIKFTEKIKNLSPDDFFINYIINVLKPRTVVVGSDHRFGVNGSGDFKLLKKLGQKYNFSIKVINHYKYHQVPVQSTRIRELLILGNIKRANELLGRHYFLTGTIKKGLGIGRKLGFPTINIQINNKFKLIPPDGVYVVKSSLDNKIYYGVMNIGIAPTISELYKLKPQRKIEIYLLKFYEYSNLYGQKILIEIIDRLRDEKKFNSIEALTKQIEEDIKKAYELIPK